MIYDGIITKPPLDELYHHGILGQKWGKKNGPPYPLSSKISTGSRLKTKKKNSYKSFSEKIKTKRRRKAIDEYGKFLNELGKSDEYMSLYNKSKDLERELEEIDVGSRSDFGRTKKGKQKIEELSKELKATLDERYKLYDYVKYRYDSIQEYKKKVPKNVQEYIDNNKHYDLEAKAEEYKRYLDNPKKWKESPDRYETKKPSQSSSELSGVSESIASKMAKDMISDFNQWAKNDREKGIDKYLWSKGQKLTKKQMQDHLQKELKKNLNKVTEDSIFKFENGSYNITINGLEEYSDGQPLYVNYDPKTKKIRDWGYV